VFTTEINGINGRLEARALSPALSRSRPACNYRAPMRVAFAATSAKIARLIRAHWRSEITIVLCALYLIPFMRVMLPRTDEGTFLSGAARLVHGQAFGRDFVEVMGPGTFYWLALFYKLFGINLLAARLCLFVSWMVTAIVVLRLGRHTSTSYRLLPLMLLVATGFNSLGRGISHHLDSNWLAMLAVLCLSLWNEKRNMRWLFLAGSLAAFTALVHQPKGLLLLFAAGLWVTTQEYRRHTAIPSLACMSSGFLLVLGVALSFFAEQGALGDAFRATCVWPLQHYSAVNDVPYGWGTFAYNWVSTPLNAPGSYGIFLLNCALIVPFLFLAVLPGLLTLQVCRRLRSIPPDVWLYVLCGLSLWVSELHRKDIVHLAFGSPLLIIVSVRLLSQSGQFLARLLLVVLTFSACSLGVFNLIGVLCAHSVSTRAGKVAMLEGGEEFAALNSRLVPGEEIFVYPYCPSYYFLTKTENPTRFSILQSGYNTPADVQEVIHVLDSKRVRHVVWDAESRKRTLPLVFPAALHLPDDLAPLEVYLRAHYKIIWSQNDFQILERKREPMVH
jgi:hypothetical protein